MWRSRHLQADPSSAAAALCLSLSVSLSSSLILPPLHWLRREEFSITATSATVMARDASVEWLDGYQDSEGVSGVASFLVMLLR